VVVAGTLLPARRAAYCYMRTSVVVY